MSLNDHDPFERFWLIYVAFKQYNLLLPIFRLILRSELETFLEHFRMFIARIGEAISSGQSWQNKGLLLF